MNKVRVLIVDDHAVVREGFHKLLEDEPGIEVIGEASDGAQAVSLAKELQPDVVLMDVTMAGMDGLDATRLIKSQSPNVKVLMLTVHESEEIFFKALEVGASGYFVKGGSSGELVSALESVARGDTYLHPSVAKKIVGQYLRGLKQGGNQENYIGLSDREREVLKLLADGRSNREIAELLNVSPNTVQTHRARLMIKLGLHNRTDLIKYALKRGFVTQDS